MESIRNLEGVPLDELYEAFNLAFLDYSVQWNKDQFTRMLKRRGFDPALSFGVFINSRLVSFTLNGIGEFNGFKTAYDTGTGTIAEFRGRGFVTKIFEHAIPFLKRESVRQYLLEVLETNTKAFSIYRKIGFETRRRLNYFKAENEMLRISHQPVSDITFGRTDLVQVRKLASRFDFQPSWQNSFASVTRSIDDFVIIGAHYEKNLAGYCITECDSGDITQIFVKQNYRNRGIGTKLIGVALDLNRGSSMKAINTDVNYEAITKFLISKGFELLGKQLEMINQL